MRKFIILNLFCIAFLYPDINVDDYNGEDACKTLVNLCYFITNNTDTIPNREESTVQRIINDFIDNEKLIALKLHILSHGHLGHYDFTKQYINVNRNKKENIFNTQPRGIFLIDNEISARIYNVRNEKITEYRYIAPFLNGNLGILSYDIIDPIVPQGKLSLLQFLDQKILFPIFKDGIIKSAEKNNDSYVFEIIVKSSLSYFQFIGITQDTGIPTNCVRFVCRIENEKLVPVTLYTI